MQLLDGKKVSEEIKNEIAIDVALIKERGEKVPQGGLAIWIEWKKNINLYQLKKELESYSIYIPQHCLYQTKQISALRIGFASLDTRQIKIIVNQLFDCYFDLQYKTSN